ncbi:MAG TPA: hypothetical protein VGB16_02275, partial [candidate division Zixibacteria bacterium]
CRRKAQARRDGEDIRLSGSTVLSGSPSKDSVEAHIEPSNPPFSKGETSFPLFGKEARFARLAEAGRIEARARGDSLNVN